jgi:hypothetical protein
VRSPTSPIGSITPEAGQIAEFPLHNVCNNQKAQPLAEKNRGEPVA